MIREVLVGAESPRHITSLALVLARNIDNINLNKLRSQFIEYGLERRWVWLIENTLAAICHELAAGLPRKQSAAYRRVDLILEAHLKHALSTRPQGSAEEVSDILDAHILSEKTLEEVQKRSSSISRLWAIVTSIQPEDFTEALRASRAPLRERLS